MSSLRKEIKNCVVFNVSCTLHTLKMISFEWLVQEDDKAKLVEETGLQLKQINNWFINQRKRNWHNNSQTSTLKSKRKRWPRPANIINIMIDRWSIYILPPIMIRYIPPMIISETHACMYMCVQVMDRRSSCTTRHGLIHLALSFSK